MKTILKKNLKSTKDEGDYLHACFGGRLFGVESCWRVTWVRVDFLQENEQQGLREPWGWAWKARITLLWPLLKPILYNSTTNNRRLIWQANHKYIEQHNEEAKLGVHSFTLRMNKFGDFTNLEFEKLFMGFNATKNMIKVDGPKYQRPLGFQAPTSVDWR